MFYYNGRFLHDKGIGSEGMGPLGVEHVAQKGFVCRGVVLDSRPDAVSASERMDMVCSCASESFGGEAIQA